MSKETFYFSHDYEPTADPKIQALIKKYDWTGYGLFWRIIEMLHSDIEHRLPKKKFIFISLSSNSTSVEQVESFVDSCINEFELFTSDGEKFWSNRCLRNIDKRIEISEGRSKAGKASALARQYSTNVQHLSTDDEQNATKERKGKEIKEKEIKIRRWTEKILEDEQFIKTAIDNNFISIEIFKQLHKKFFDTKQATTEHLNWNDERDCRKNFLSWLPLHIQNNKIQNSKPIPTPKYKLASDD